MIIQCTHVYSDTYACIFFHLYALLFVRIYVYVGVHGLRVPFRNISCRMSFQAVEFKQGLRGRESHNLSQPCFPFQEAPEFLVLQIGRQQSQDSERHLSLDTSTHPKQCVEGGLARPHVYVCFYVYVHVYVYVYVYAGVIARLAPCSGADRSIVFVITSSHAGVDFRDDPLQPGYSLGLF